MTVLTPTSPTAATVAPPAEVVTWTTVLRLPESTRLLAGTLIGRLPLGMAPIALLQGARADGGSFAAGGTLAALYGLAVAAGQPALGRLVDRTGQTRVLLGSAAISALALLTLAATGMTSPARAAVLVVLAGAGAPPLEASMRALWAKVMPTQQHLRAAYSLDSGSQELVYVAGPLLATGAVLLSGPSVALGLTAGLGLAGALVVALSPSSRSWMPAPRKRRDPLGALRPLEARVLLLALVAVGSALGALNVAALAASERHAASWMAGAVPAAVSIGALIGSALYAGRRWPGSDATHLAWAAGGFVLAWLPLCLDPAPLMAVALAVVPGVFFGPLLTASYLVLDQVTPPSCTVEAFGWLVGAFGVGTALGQAAAGAGNGRWAGPTAAAAIAFGLLLLIRRLTDKTRPLH